MDFFSVLCTSAVGRMIDVTIREVAHANGTGVTVIIAAVSVISYLAMFRHFSHVKVLVSALVECAAVIRYALSLAVYTWVVGTAVLFSIYTFVCAVSMHHPDLMQMIYEGWTRPVKYSFM
jgi:hypothetical protein